MPKPWVAFCCVESFIKHIRYQIALKKTKQFCLQTSTSSKMASLNYIYIDMFKGKTCLCVCVWPCLYSYTFMCLPAHFTCMCSYAHVGVWMSVCMSLCCHICCYQGNPVGRRRSAERCTAWRRETCGAQPVAGKKPVRDSPTNPVHFPCPWDELFLTRNDS